MAAHANRTYYGVRTKQPADTVFTAQSIGGNLLDQDSPWAKSKPTGTHKMGSSPYHSHASTPDTPRRAYSPRALAADGVQSSHRCAYVLRGDVPDDAHAAALAAPGVLVQLAQAHAGGASQILAPQYTFALIAASGGRVHMHIARHVRGVYAG